MNPFQLLIELLLATRQLRATWYGQSALTAVDTLEFPLAADVLTGTVPSTFTIDLAPLLAEIVNGAIADEEALRAVDELLPLRDLLSAQDFTALGDALYDFLWQEAQADVEFGIGKGEPEKAWSDPDRRARARLVCDQPPAGQYG